MIRRIVNSKYMDVVMTNVPGPLLMGVLLSSIFVQALCADIRGQLTELWHRSENDH